MCPVQVIARDGHREGFPLDMHICCCMEEYWYSTESNSMSAYLAT